MEFLSFGRRPAPLQIGTRQLFNPPRRYVATPILSLLLLRGEREANDVVEAVGLKKLAVPICTALAPARKNSMASSMVVMAADAK